VKEISFFEVLIRPKRKKRRGDRGAGQYLREAKVSVKKEMRKGNLGG
jgi:hypothetical protein